MNAIIFIPLTQHKVTIIDFEDFEKIRGRKCRASWNGRKWYVKCGEKYLHRLLLNTEAGREIDHINNDGFDNRRENLRECSRTQNLRAAKVKKQGASSQFRGVCLRPKTGVWRANIVVSGTSKFLGNFQNENDAARAYDAAAKKYFGNFATSNL